LGVAEFHHDVGELARQRRVEEQGGDEVVPFLQKMQLGDGYERESPHGVEDGRNRVQRLQIVAGRGGSGDDRSGEKAVPGDRGQAGGDGCCAEPEEGSPRYVRRGLRRGWTRIVDHLFSFLCGLGGEQS
jgi:hypothetical protein